MALLSHGTVGAIRGVWGATPRHLCHLPTGDAHPLPHPHQRLGRLRARPRATRAKCATNSASSCRGGRRCSPCVSGATSRVGAPCRHSRRRASPCCPPRAHLSVSSPDQVFGCSLQVLCERERGTVPRFVQQCIQTVERRGTAMGLGDGDSPGDKGTGWRGGASSGVAPLAGEDHV